MLANFDEVFNPWERLKNTKLTDHDPCKNCKVHTQWLKEAMYGSPAQRENASRSAPEECGKCKDRIIWTIDCIQKLKMYEDRDERLSNA